ncbi:hypothetical protein QLS71_004035 [Mariniflexile litorale]|uniref:Uncharacterized protein n=1 Tax=Mariniflexile litorale TaxID=3045158 RepID=A0AAU7EIB0_9FLAO|nr:hypothetical protein [Mariniflexile sp. KMM 9835]MDQ8210190.1 hypothetical protein [Mariniflexile sp. KMM 9835]
MLRNLKTYFEFGNRFCGVEHGLLNDQEIIYATVLKKTKNNVILEHTFKNVALENVISKLHKKQAVFLIINNNNVLTKHIESSQTALLKLAHHAFPNVDLDDFFYEVISQENNNHVVSICRKEYIEGLILNYKTYGVSLIDISLGNAIITSISRFLNTTPIITSNACISMDTDRVTSVEKKNIEDTITYDVNGLQVTNWQLLSLAGALNILLDSFYPITNFGALKIIINSPGSIPYS